MAIQMKATVCAVLYYNAVITLYKVALTLESVNEIMCDHLIK